MQAFPLFIRHVFLFVLPGLLAFNCRTGDKTRTIQTPEYELNIAPNQQAVLILFPCFPCDYEHTKREAGFLKGIDKQGITTVLLNFNQKLFLRPEEKETLYNSIDAVFEKHRIKKSKLYFGGFSSGGNMALLMCDYVFEKNNALNAAGVMVVDAPVDLEQLYKNAQNDISLNADEGARKEGLFLADLLERALGRPDDAQNRYPACSPFLVSANAALNLPNHRKYKIRLYTEPAPDWQMQFRKRRYEDTNAFMLEKLADCLQKQGNQRCELVRTENRGYRADGTRHPHSWNIVAQKELLAWMKSR